MQGCQPLSEADVSLDVWDAGERAIVNEPLFVPRPNAAAEDDGWVLAAVHDAAAGQGRLVILDARRLADGPVATIHLQHFLPAGLHGSFSSQVWGPLADAAGEGVPSAAPLWREPNNVRGL